MALRIILTATSFICQISALDTIDCSQGDLCTRSSTISCNSTDDCNIICETEICNGKTFICPKEKNKHCNIRCTGNACLYSSFDASDSYGIQLKLSLISSGNQNVWAYGSLFCPPNGHCSIISTNDNIKHNYIAALNSNSLNITVFGSHSDSNLLYETDIYCPMKSDIYCDLNINNGILSNANIYISNPDFLWIICANDKNCFDNQQETTLYCGDQYSAECHIRSEKALKNCVCNPEQTILSAVTIINTTVNKDENAPNNGSFFRDQTKTNLYFVIVVLSSMIATVLCTLCFFGIRFKIKYDEMQLRQNSNIPQTSVPKQQKYKPKSQFKRPKKQLNIVQNSDAVSLVSPGSVKSGMSSLHLTVNKLFGKDIIEAVPRGVIACDDEPKLNRLQPPIPPVSMPRPKATKQRWNKVQQFEYPMNVQSIRLSAPSIPCIQSDSEVNSGARERSRGLTNVPEIPWDENSLRPMRKYFQSNDASSVSGLNRILASEQMNMDDKTHLSVSLSTPTETEQATTIACDETEGNTLRPSTDSYDQFTQYSFTENSNCQSN